MLKAWTIFFSTKSSESIFDFGFPEDEFSVDAEDDFLLDT